MRVSRDLLALALLGVPINCQALGERDLEDLAKRSGSKRAPLHIRDALSEHAINLIHEHGQNIDLSLEGYDHDLVSRSMEEGSFEPRSFDADIAVGGPQKFGRMQPHHVLKERGLPEGQRLRRREALMEEETIARAQLGAGIDYTLEGYDDILLGRSLDVRDGVDYSLAGYDPNLLGRDVESEEDEEEEIDYSLEGYDHALVARSLKSGFVELDDVGSGADPHTTTVKGPPMMGRREAADSSSSATTATGSWSVLRRWIKGWIG